LIFVSASKTSNLELIEFPLADSFPARNRNWTQCMEIRVLGRTCIELYFVTSNLTIGARLIIQNRIIIDQSLQGNKLCLDEKRLISLIMFIPPLLPFKPVIDSILYVFGFIPANVFSICMEAKNLQITRDHIKGKMELQTTLMCYKDTCLLRGIQDFGNFTINIPVKQSPIRLE